jgi:hypothetical protein
MKIVCYNRWPHTFSSNLSEIDSIIIENLDTVGSVIRDENFLSVIHNHSVGKLKVLGATKLVQDIAHLEKNTMILLSRKDFKCTGKY